MALTTGEASRASRSPEHSETKQTPWQRWSSAPTPQLPKPAQLREAFLWSQWRTVTKTATVGLHGNTYVHAKARADDPAPPPAPTGIDYLGLVEQQHAAELAERVQYSRLRDETVPDGHVRGQLPLPDADSGPIGGVDGDTDQVSS